MVQQRVNVFVINAGTLAHLFSNYHSSCCIAFLLFPPIQSSNVFLRKCQNHFSSRSLKLKHLGLVIEILSLIGKVIGIVINSANVNHAEVLNEILPKHEESSIVFKTVSQSIHIERGNLLPKLFVRFGSSAVPFFMTPWVSHF